jgi:phage/plasmid-like protein (TIGR03299 family)
LTEPGQVYRVKHTRNSEMRVADARQALNVLNQTAEAFEAEVAKLLDVDVTDTQWQQFVAAYAPVKDDATPRSLTMADNKRQELTRLWTHDRRVQPWHGTAYGVIQAVNTYVHWEGIVRGTNRIERNMLRAASGGADKLDQGTATLLGQVLNLDLSTGKRLAAAAA